MDKKDSVISNKLGGIRKPLSPYSLPFWNSLTILTGKNCFTQFTTGMAAWLLLTFLVCSHNQLSSILSKF